MKRKGGNTSTAAVDSIRASVIVPTYKEGGNVEELTHRLFKALPSKGDINKSNVELIFVDDNSRDGSEEKVNALGKQYNVRIIVRTTERGLSSAVIRGFNEGQGDLLLCMDADLQHPPEQVPDLLTKLAEKDTEFVLGTRYAKGQGGVDKDWPFYRRVISEAARMLSRPLTPLSDPMSGFFGIRQDIYQRGQNINPIGFKIALELYVKCGCSKLQEVPFLFGVRTAGESKLSGKVIVKYIQQLAQLYFYRFPIISILFILFIVAAVVATVLYGPQYVRQFLLKNE